ncbi:hypothetical protein NDU88_008366 [Pleurodeles waltl]|uniref:Uncharacterized protein n=1 Tax=Pleurodeles waltl TaxID=8319 RepID=A0AAV7RSU7_PLEWA|nr:hypothetical protein NDU88_008366 [Pleurodeles waltl]
MATWRLTSPSEVDRLSQLTYFYFTENEGRVLWEAYKVALRGEIIAGEVVDKRKRNQQCDELEQQIHTLETEYAQQPGAKVEQKLGKSRLEYRVTATNEMKLIYQAQQCRLYESGDKARKMLVWLVHREAVRSHITAMTDPQGVTLHTSVSIAETAVSYMRDLYRGGYEGSSGELQEFVNDCPCRRLGKLAAEALEEEEIIREIGVALAQLQPWKKPDPSGLLMKTSTAWQRR